MSNCSPNPNANP